LETFSNREALPNRWQTQRDGPKVVFFTFKESSFQDGTMVALASVDVADGIGCEGIASHPLYPTFHDNSNSP
jgi:hypothetical protein